MKAILSPRRLFCLLFVFVLVGIAPGYGAITSKRMLAAIMAHTPAPEIVPAGMAMKTAEHVAKQRGDTHVLWGNGESMLPLYARGTALLVAEHDYKKLKKGMTAVYVNRAGRRVAHCIVGEIRGGYLVQGLNNAEEDEELVTPDNFLGVVVAAYASSTTDYRTAMLEKLAPKARTVATRQ